MLELQLKAQRERVALYEAYYNGQHPLQFQTVKYQEAFGNLFGAFADNWCQIVVDSAVERLRVVGFEINGEPNEDAWEIWQRNSLDVESVVAHTEAGKSGQAYLLVDPNDGEPRITIEHASQMVVATDPGDRRRRLAALKRWLGDDGFQYLTLYLPEIVYRFEAEDIPGRVELDWVPRTDVDPEVSNPLGVVPVIPLESKPGLLGAPHSDLEPAVPLQNAVNKLCTDMVIASEYAAFPQRVITGVSVPKDPETNEPIFTGAERKKQLEAALSRAWFIGPPDARATSLPAADLSNFVVAINLFIQHLAAQTKTPPHYLLGQVVNASGDALSVAEAGLVSKCRTKILFFSDAWEEAIALAMTAAGKETDHSVCETMWANPERVALGQLVDAAVKKQTLGVPDQVIWLELGYTPEQIENMTDLEAEVEPPVPPPTPPPPVPPGAVTEPTEPGGTDG